MKKIFTLIFGLFVVMVVFSFGQKSNVLGYGFSTVGSTNAGIAPICGYTAPSAPWLYKIDVKSTSEVELFWTGVDNVSSWTVAYGWQSGRYIWGLSNFGNDATRSVRIGSLPGGTFYFVVRANNQCMPGYFSSEKSVSVGGTRARTVSAVYPQTPQTIQPITVVTPTTVPNYGTRTGGLRESAPTPLPTRRYIQPIVTQTPLPTPIPVKTGFFQGIFDFIGGLFGGR